MEIQKSEPAEEMESESHEKDLADNLLHSKKKTQRKQQEQIDLGRSARLNLEIIKKKHFLG